MVKCLVEFVVDQYTCICTLVHVFQFSSRSLFFLAWIFYICLFTCLSTCIFFYIVLSELPSRMILLILYSLWPINSPVLIQRTILIGVNKKKISFQIFYFSLLVVIQNVYIFMFLLCVLSLNEAI